MQLLFIDRHFDILPVFRSKRTVLIEASCVRLGSTDQNAHTICNFGKKPPLGAIQVDGTDQDDFVICSDFFVVDREPPRGLHIPKAGGMQFVQVSTLEFRKNLPANLFGRASELLNDIIEVDQVRGELTVECAQDSSQIHPRSQLGRIGNFEEQRYE